MKQLPLVASVLVAVVIIGGTFALTQKPSTSTASNVSREGETQVIEVQAKGGYFPKATTAQAGVPTVLRLKTNGTYDCSAAVTIPKLGFQKNLDASGVTEVTIPPQEPGTTLQGVCAMGMYNFQIQFAT